MNILEGGKESDNVNSFRVFTHVAMNQKSEYLCLQVDCMSVSDQLIRLPLFYVGAEVTI